MRLLALLMLCAVVAVHHGVPVLGHAAHAPGSPGAAAADHGQHGQPGDAGDDGAIIGACLAVLVAAGLAMSALRPRRGVLVPRLGPRVARMRIPAVPGPPAHGPPRPLRPCVLQR